MHGIVLTQAKRTLYYQPSAAPIMFEKIKGAPTTVELKTSIGVIRSNDPEYNRMNRVLTDVERHVINFALTPLVDPTNQIGT
jgi:hypothetical protein